MNSQNGDPSDNSFVFSHLLYQDVVNPFGLLTICQPGVPSVATLVVSPHDTTFPVRGSPRPTKVGVRSVCMNDKELHCTALELGTSGKLM